MVEHLNPNREIKEGVLVRWTEYPDRLYFVTKTGIKHCGKDNYCRIETIDHIRAAVVPMKDLAWDDVDYIECTKEEYENVKGKI